MSTWHVNVEQLPVELGDGLVLRRARAADASALADFNAMIQSEEGPDKPDERVAVWTIDLMTKPHPTFDPRECTIIEEVSTGRIISTMNLIPQTWTYGGIPFKVGRPELVGTLMEYRHRGLVRLQFEVIHRWSAEHGEKLQIITGIPYYYRQFGYEMALNSQGGRYGYPTHIPNLEAGKQEDIQIRPAIEADISFISKLYKLGCERSLVACQREDMLWHYELSGKGYKNGLREELRVIETLNGKPCGFFAHPPFTLGDMMVLHWYEILPECSWLDITPCVMRYLRAAYDQYLPYHGEKKPFGRYGFWLGEDHPVYDAVRVKLPSVSKPYAFYIRLPDLPGFLKLISPVLENNLAASPLAGYQGELKITFYRNGVRLVFEHGRLVTTEEWKPSPMAHSGNAGFPPHTFLQLLFGYRTMEMLKTSFPDCWTDRDEIHVLLDALFPRQPSDVWPIS